mmetsp:Transcript_52360/g.91000  ORF Transcript_52360/g.91000 Transcript_52360/m.91000 type:complete len:205 (+) Transcript_52360:664-1278(+)
MHQLFTCLLLISIGYICPSLSISKYVGDLLPRNRWLCRVRFVLLLVARCCCLCSPRRRPFGWAGGEGFAPLGNPIVHVHLCIGGGRGQCLPPCHCAWAVAAGAPLRMHSSSIHMRLYMWSWLYRWLLPLPPWLLLLPLTPWKRLRLLLLLLQLLLLLLLLLLPTPKPLAALLALRSQAEHCQAPSAVMDPLTAHCLHFLHSLWL